jgi:hypothetical protein
MDWINLWEWVQDIEPEQLPEVPWEYLPGRVITDNKAFAEYASNVCRPGDGAERSGRAQEMMRALHRVIQKKEYTCPVWGREWMERQNAKRNAKCNKR